LPPVAGSGKKLKGGRKMKEKGWRKRVRVGAIVLMLLAVAVVSVNAVTKNSLNTEDSAGEPQLMPNGSVDGKIETLDNIFAEVARNVPAFGGLFLDEKDSDILYVYLLEENGIK